MKKIFTNLANVVFSKVTLITVIVQWIFTLWAVYDRGRLNGSFHSFYEPLFFQIMLLLNIPAGAAAYYFTPGNPFLDKDNPLFSIFVLIASVTIQWTFIGSLINYIFYTDRK